MTIIAESGATKTDWVCGGVSLRTRGINLSVMTDADVSAVVAEAAGKLLASCPGMDAGTLRQGGVSRVFFYGAGLVSEDSGRRLRRIGLCGACPPEWSQFLGQAQTAAFMTGKKSS